MLTAELRINGLMLFPSRPRYHPRSAEERARALREAALRAQVADLTARVEQLEKEQQIQFKRIAELQMALDLALKALKQGNQ